MREGWEIRKLGEVCDIKNGRSQKSVENPNGHYPIYGSGGIMGYADDFICEAGTTIIGRKGTINKPLYVECAFWNVDTAFGLQPKSSTNPRFLYYTCKSIDFNCYNKSTTLPSLVKSDLLKIEVSVPPVQEQEKIVAELDCLSGIIEKKRQQLKEQDNLAQSIFYNMFGDPITNEKGWETKKVIDVVSLQRGYDLPVQSRTLGSVPIYGSNGVIGYHNASKVDRGIITGRSGTIGLVYSCEGPFWPLNTTLFSTNTHGNNLVYLKYLLTAFDLKRFAEGAGVPTLNRNTFHNKPIISVPLAQQNEFAWRIDAVEKQKELIRHSIAEIETLFNSRMAFWFK